MSVIRIASRYAKSLIDLAVEQDNLERIREDIGTFQEAVKNRDLYLLLKSPIINAGKKQQVLDAIFGDRLDKTTNAFFRIILNKGRESVLPEIANAFVDQYKAIKHISTVKLTTATKLSDDTIERIKAQLTSSAATDSNIDLVTETNPDILGGFVIEFDDKLYDASVSHKLDQLRKEFSNNQYVKNF